MANPTTYFGWVMPTSTNLVTNLPADFNVFGQGVDTSLQYLLGGTTGQVLSKTSGTNMAFTWVTPTDQTPLTTKGDLFTFTTVDARLGVGNNGESLVADSTTTTGLRWQGSYAAGRNAILNSNYSVWQRGTTFANPNNLYTADRWLGSTAAAGTITRQATGDTTNLPNIQYCLRYQRTAASTSTSLLSITQSMETVNSIPFAGKAVTLSFYARAGANYSATSNALAVNLYTGTGTDQNVFLTGYTGSAQPIAQTATLTTTWQRFTYTATLAATTTEIGLIFIGTPTGTAGANDYYEITGVQLEAANTASPYAPNSTTYQGELAACQRYYFATQAGTNSFIGYAYATNGTIYDIPFPVSMRTNPTALVTSGTCSAYALNASTSITPTFDKAGTSNAQILGAITITAGQGSRIECGANAIGFSAEL